MKWIRKIKNSLISQKESEDIGDQKENPELQEGPDEGLDTIPHTMIYDKIDTYYKSKNADFQFVIGIVCFSSKSNKKKSEEFIMKEIERLSACINNADFDEEDRIRFKNMIFVYKDIIRFRDHFSIKRGYVSIRRIFDILKEVQENNVKKSNETHNSDLYDIIKERLNDNNSQHDIIKTFLVYNVENGNSDFLNERCILDLPYLLSNFGFLYDEYNDDLNSKVIHILKELADESFEKNI